MPSTCTFDEREAWFRNPESLSPERLASVEAYMAAHTTPYPSPSRERYLAQRKLIEAEIERIAEGVGRILALVRTSRAAGGGGGGAAHPASKMPNAAKLLR